jgi:hypothetical protein
MREKTHLKFIVIFTMILLLSSVCARAGTWTELTKPGANTTLPYGIDGDNIVGWYNQSGDHGFRYDGSTWYTLNVPGAKNTYAQGISGSSIVGYYADKSFNYRGFLYDGSAWITLNAPGAEATFAYDIEGSNIVGRYKLASSSYYSGFLYDGSTWTSLDAPDAIHTEALGISGGKIFGSYVDHSANSHGFIYDGTTWITLDAPAAGGGDGNSPSGQGTGLSDGDGSKIVGWHINAITDYEEALSYDGSNWTIISPPGAVASWAEGVSGSNIVGGFWDSSYQTHGFIYTNPEPATVLLLGLGGLALLRKRSA